MPLVVALAVGQAAVLNRDAGAERARKSAGDRRRQRDLRHQHQHAAPGAHARDRRAAGKPRSCRCRSRRAAARRGNRRVSASAVELLERGRLLVGQRRARVAATVGRRGSRSNGSRSPAARRTVDEARRRRGAQHGARSRPARASAGRRQPSGGARQELQRLALPRAERHRRARPASSAGRSRRVGQSSTPSALSAATRVVLKPSARAARARRHAPRRARRPGPAR